MMGGPRAGLDPTQKNPCSRGESKWPFHVRPDHSLITYNIYPHVFIYKLTYFPARNSYFYAVTD